MNQPGKDDFYIGYRDAAPAAHASLLRKVIPALIAALLVLAFFISRSQKGFSTGEFELGQITEVSGLISLAPVPMLTLDDGKESLPLIGYGKFGAEGALLQAFGSSYSRKSLYRATVKGTLIYRDGKTLMELTERSGSILEWEVLEELPADIEPLGRVEVRGEIIDPKCYFGVMKPGEGKPHRSCAIRCIAGGIPPMLRVDNGMGQTDYLILLGERGQAINQEVLDYVAEPVELSGELFQFNNWLILNRNEAAGITPLL